MNDENRRKLEEKLRSAKIINNTEKNIIEAKVNWLLKQNEDILDTVDVRLLTPYYDELFDSFDLISMLSVYPKIQEKIVNLSPQKYKLFVSIMKYMDRSQAEWITVAEDYLDNVTSGKYDDLFLDPKMRHKIDDLYKKKPEEFSKKDLDEIEDTMGLLTNMNMFEIKSYKELKNINLNKKYNDLLIGNIKNEYVSNLNKIDKLKHIIFLKKFGYGLDVANIFEKRYLDDYDEIIKIIDSEDEQEIRKYLVEKRGLTDLNEIASETERIKKENEAVKEHLTALKEIGDITDLKKLNQYNQNIQNVSPTNNAYRMDSVIRKFFCRQKNKELYQVKPQDKVVIDGIDAYMIQDDFKISVSSLKSYSNSFDWDVKKLQNHGICTSLMANNNMNHAPIRGACLGFTDFHEQSLYASSPWDLASDRFANNMNISKAKTKFNNPLGEADIKFYTPNSQIDRTRRRSNEDINERRELDLKKIDVANEKFKKQPAYVVYFSETSLFNFLNGGKDEVLNSENLKKYLDVNKLNDVSYRARLVEQYAKDDPLWEESKKEKSQRGTDMVIVDRTYFALRERLKIDQIENDILNYDVSRLESSKEDMDRFLSLIERLIVESENNRAGFSIRDNADDSKSGQLIHEEIRENLFSKEIMQDRLSKIESKIASLNHENQDICYKKLLQITKGEIEKYNHAYFSKDPGYDLEEYAKECILKSRNGKGFSNINSILQEIDLSCRKKWRRTCLRSNRRYKRA